MAIPSCRLLHTPRHAGVYSQDVREIGASPGSHCGARGHTLAIIPTEGRREGYCTLDRSFKPYTNGLPSLLYPPPPPPACIGGIRRDSRRDKISSKSRPQIFHVELFPRCSKIVHIVFDRLFVRTSSGYPVVVHSVSLSPRAASVAGLGPMEKPLMLWGGLLPLSATIPVVTLLRLGLPVCLQ